MKVTVLGDATPCRLVNEYRSFKRNYCCCGHMPKRLKWHTSQTEQPL